MPSKSYSTTRCHFPQTIQQLLRNQDNILVIINEYNSVYLYYLMRVTVPTVLNIPEPRFVPQHDETIHKAVRVVDAAPRVFTEFHQRRWFILPRKLLHINKI